MSEYTASAVNLYNPDTFVSLTADHKAARVGDVLTVLVLEQSQATTNVEITTGKEANSGLGYEFKDTPFNLGFHSNGKNSADGKNHADGFVKNEFTVKIVHISPMGIYTISGFKTIVYNKEEQTIKLDAEVRREDISSDNTVLSNRLANLKMSIVGTGNLSNAQKGNIFTSLLSLFGL